MTSSYFHYPGIVILTAAEAVTNDFSGGFGGVPSFC
jgi:hypothetical protein